MKINHNVNSCNPSIGFRSKKYRFNLVTYFRQFIIFLIFACSLVLSTPLGFSDAADELAKKENELATGVQIDTLKTVLDAANNGLTDDSLVKKLPTLGKEGWGNVTKLFSFVLYAQDAAQDIKDKDYVKLGIDSLGYALSFAIDKAAEKSAVNLSSSVFVQAGHKFAVSFGWGTLIMASKLAWDSHKAVHNQTAKLEIDRLYETLYTDPIVNPPFIGPLPEGRIRMKTPRLSLISNDEGVVDHLYKKIIDDPKFEERLRIYVEKKIAKPQKGNWASIPHRYAHLDIHPLMEFSRLHNTPQRIDYDKKQYKAFLDKHKNLYKDRIKLLIKDLNTQIQERIDFYNFRKKAMELRKKLKDEKRAWKLVEIMTNIHKFADKYKKRNNLLITKYTKLNNILNQPDPLEAYKNLSDEEKGNYPGAFTDIRKKIKDKINSLYLTYRNQKGRGLSRFINQNDVSKNILEKIKKSEEQLTEGKLVIQKTHMSIEFISVEDDDLSRLKGAVFAALKEIDHKGRYVKTDVQFISADKLNKIMTNFENFLGKDKLGIAKVKSGSTVDYKAEIIWRVTAMKPGIGYGDFTVSSMPTLHFDLSSSGGKPKIASIDGNMFWDPVWEPFLRDINEKINYKYEYLYKIVKHPQPELAYKLYLRRQTGDLSKEQKNLVTVTREIRSMLASLKREYINQSSNMDSRTERVFSFLEMKNSEKQQIRKNIAAGYKQYQSINQNLNDIALFVGLQANVRPANEETDLKKRLIAEVKRAIYDIEQNGVAYKENKLPDIRKKIMGDVLAEKLSVFRNYLEKETGSAAVNIDDGLNPFVPNMEEAYVGDLTWRKTLINDGKKYPFNGQVPTYFKQSDTGNWKIVGIGGKMFWDPGNLPSTMTLIVYVMNESKATLKNAIATLFIGKKQIASKTGSPVKFTKLMAGTYKVTGFADGYQISTGKTVTLNPAKSMSKEQIITVILKKDKIPQGDKTLLIDLPLCKYWVVGAPNKPVMTGYYYTKQGKKIEYTSQPMSHVPAGWKNGSFDSGGMLLAKSGTGYHVYMSLRHPTEGYITLKRQMELRAAGDTSEVEVYSIVNRMRGEKSEIILNKRTYGHTMSCPADMSTYTLKYRTDPKGPWKSLLLD